MYFVQMWSPIKCLPSGSPCSLPLVSEGIKATKMKMLEHRFNTSTKFFIVSVERVTQLWMSIHEHNTPKNVKFSGLTTVIHGLSPNKQKSPPTHYKINHSLSTYEKIIACTRFSIRALPKRYARLLYRYNYKFMRVHETTNFSLSLFA